MKRESFLEIVKNIQRLAPDQRGIFTFSDLWNLTALGSSDRTAKVVNRLVREKILFKIRRNIYTTDNPDLWILAFHLKRNAYISMDSVLSRNGLIGTIPRSVCLAYPGPPDSIETPFGLLRFFKIKKDLIFGIQLGEFGIRIADNEKAYLDLLYYYMKGARFVIDPLSDVDLWKLDRKKIQKYLHAYKNPKFVVFVKGLIHEKP